MKIAKKSDVKVFKNSDRCIAYEYPTEDADINGAVIELSGRYPDSGRVVNQKCKELVYIISGSGKLVIEDREISLSQDDQVIVEPGERYFFDGELRMLTSCTPAWYPEQHIQVD